MKKEYDSLSEDSLFRQGLQAGCRTDRWIGETSIIEDSLYKDPTSYVWGIY